MMTFYLESKSCSRGKNEPFGMKRKHELHGQFLSITDLAK